MVKLYFNEELADVTLNQEDAEKYEELMSKLNIARTHQDSSSNSIIPYVSVNTSMFNVINTLCPISVSYKDYNVTSIPLDVLKAIDFCVDKKFFQEIEIHYNDENPDPFVIGVNRKWYNNAKNEKGDWKLYDTKEECIADEINNGAAYEKSNMTRKYLIAKWGDEHKPFDVLMKEASEKLKNSIGSKLRSQKSSIENKLSALDDNINLYLLGKLAKYEID